MKKRSRYYTGRSRKNQEAWQAPLGKHLETLKVSINPAGETRLCYVDDNSFSEFRENNEAREARSYLFPLRFSGFPHIELHLQGANCKRH